MTTEAEARATADDLDRITGGTAVVEVVRRGASVIRDLLAVIAATGRGLDAATVVDALTAFYGEQRDGWSMGKVRRMRAALVAAGFSYTPEATGRTPDGPAFIAQMPPSPETSRRHWSMYCRVCGIEEYMADSADDAGLVAHRDEHNARVHAAAGFSHIPEDPGAVSDASAIRALEVYYDDEGQQFDAEGIRRMKAALEAAARDTPEDRAHEFVHAFEGTRCMHCGIMWQARAVMSCARATRYLREHGVPVGNFLPARDIPEDRGEAGALS